MIDIISIIFKVFICYVTPMAQTIFLQIQLVATNKHIKGAICTNLFKVVNII
jgi:hypothetical protein